MRSHARRIIRLLAALSLTCVSVPTYAQTDWAVVDTLAPKVGRGFISDGGGDGAIVIFDLKTNIVLGSIVAKEDADGTRRHRSRNRSPLLPAEATVVQVV